MARAWEDEKRRRLRAQGVVWHRNSPGDSEQFLLLPSLFHMSQTSGLWLWTRGHLTAALSFTQGLDQAPSPTPSPRPAPSLTPTLCFSDHCHPGPLTSSLWKISRPGPGRGALRLRPQAWLSAAQLHCSVPGPREHICSGPGRPPFLLISCPTQGPGHSAPCPLQG